MRIFLIHPPIDMLEKDVVGISPPLGIAYIAAYLEKFGHEVRLFDYLILSWKNPIKIQKNGQTFLSYSLPPTYLEKTLKEFKPHIVGISNLFTTSEKYVLNLAKQIKSFDKNIKTVVGGTNCSAKPGYFLKNQNVDYVVLGEGEETMKNLVHHLETGLPVDKIDGLGFKKKDEPIINPKTYFIENLDELPFPAWHLLPMQKYFLVQKSGNFLKKREFFATVLTSRGCVRNCVFCSGIKLLGKWRGRSPQNVINEIKSLINLYDVPEIQFMDANIAVNPERLSKICKELIKNCPRISWSALGGMDVNFLKEDMIKEIKKSGCFFMPLGIEHGNSEMQKMIGKIVPLDKVKLITKKCKELGIWTLGFFVLGLPGETMETANESLLYAKKSGIDSASFFTATPIPGSRLYDEIRQTQTIDLDDLGFFSQKGISPSGISNEELNRLRKKFFVSFAIHKIKKEINLISLYYRLKNIRSIDDLKFYLGVLLRFIKVAF